MDYFIQGTLCSEVEYNPGKFGMFLLGELGNGVGLQFNTAINDYRKGILTVGTLVEYIVVHEGSTNWLARTRQISMFSFPTEATLKRGPTKKALSAIKECVDLSQAYAYATISMEFEDGKLPEMGCTIQPYSQTEAAILAFLKKYNQLSKK